MILNEIERAVICGTREYRTNADFIDAIEGAVIEKLCAWVVDKTKPAIETTAFSRDNSTQHYYTADQLHTVAAASRVKALEDAADTCNSTMYIDSDGSVGKYGPMTHANTEIKKCADAIRAMKGAAA